MCKGRPEIHGRDSARFLQRSSHNREAVLSTYAVKKLAFEPLRIDEQQLCERYESLYTGAVSDVLREHGLMNQALPTDVLPLRDTMRVAGFAFTIKGAKNPATEGEMNQRVAMLESITRHSVCVFDTTRDDESAHWGEVMTKAAIRAGCRGAIVDGGIRDTQLILDQNFPIFCRYRTSSAMLGRFRMIDFQIPVRVGKVLVTPGDLVFGDIDGAIVVPRALCCDVLEKAEAIRKDEQEYKRWLDEGLSAQEVVKRGGNF